MKVTTSANQTLKQEELKTSGTKTTKQAQESKNSSKIDKAKSVDVSEMKDTKLVQNLKNTNNDIGRLQVAQKSLQNIESDVKKFADLSVENKESLEKNEKDEIHTQMRSLKKNIEATLKKATFEGSSVFAKSIKDGDGNVIFDAPKLKVGLLDTDAKKFYDTMKEQQAEIKEAIEVLKEQANSDAQKLSAKNSINKVAKQNVQDMQETDTSFLKKLGSLFRVSHNTNNLSSQRVQELLT